MIGHSLVIVLILQLYQKRKRGQSPLEELHKDF